MIELRDITRSFGETAVLHGVSLRFEEGQFTSLLGPSGCGKSTTLRIIAGLDQATSGQVLMGGRDVSTLTASQRNIAMVFQSYALYPHLSVAQNIAMPLVMRQLSALQRAPFIGGLIPGSAAKRADIMTHVLKVARILSIEPLLQRKPSELSGGQKQRVAIGRALVRDPAAFLLDEPLSNLDAKLRVQMRNELSTLHRNTGKTFIYVTHDQAEAMSMSDKVAVFLGGRIAQAGTPRDLYNRPATADVAAFIGARPINMLTPSPEFGGLLLQGRNLQPGAVPQRFGLRPDHLKLSSRGRFRGRLVHVEYLGPEVLLDLRMADDTLMRIAADEHAELPPLGDDLRFDIAPWQIHIFDADGNRIEEERR